MAYSTIQYVLHVLRLSKHHDDDIQKHNTTSHYIYVPKKSFLLLYTVTYRGQLPTGNNNNIVLIHDHKAGGGTKQNSLNYPLQYKLNMFKNNNTITAVNKIYIHKIKKNI